MKSWHKIVIALVIIMLIVGGTFWWIHYHELSMEQYNLGMEQHELSKGQLAIIGDTNSGHSIYLFDPLLQSWHRLSTDNLYPYHMAWSPDGKQIAFTYSTSNADQAAVTGVAILNLRSAQTQQVYSPPSDESLNTLTWSPDGQSLIFDVYRNNDVIASDLIALGQLNLQTGKLQTFPFQKAVQPQYFDINHIEVAQNTDFVMGGSQGVFIAPTNLETLRQVSPYMTGFILTPDRKEITTTCPQSESALCTYSTDTTELTRTYSGPLPNPNNGYLNGGNWSYDEKDVVYLLQGGGEEEPQYIMLVDMQNNRNYVVYKQQKGFVIWQLVWYSAK